MSGIRRGWLLLGALFLGCGGGGGAEVDMDAAGDFRINASSALVDVGVDARAYTSTPGAAFSFSASRPQGSAWDVGAYEVVPNN